MKEIKIRINNIEWLIEFVGYKDDKLEIGEEDYRIAVTYKEEGKIVIQKELFENDKGIIKQVLIHEIVHAYQMSYGMLQVFWDNEIVADFIAAHIKSILRTYYEIINEITNGEKKTEEKEDIDDFGLHFDYRGIYDEDNGMELEEKEK